MWPAQNPTWTKSPGFKTGHASRDTEFLRRAIRRDDDAVAVPSAADPDRAVLQLGIKGDFAACEEAVAVHVQNPDGALCAHGYRVLSIAPEIIRCQS